MSILNILNNRNYEDFVSIICNDSDPISEYNHIIDWTFMTIIDTMRKEFKKHGER